jgi:hypothetical protein
MGKVLVASGCYLLVWGGFIQAWMFTDGFAPKPALYDLLTPLPLWPLSILLLLPLAVLSLPFGPQAFGLLAPDTFPGALAIALQLYLGSEAALTLWSGLRPRRVRHFQGESAGG